MVLNRLQHGLVELWPGRTAGVPVSVHPTTTQGGPALSPKRLGLGRVLQDALHHVAVQILAQDMANPLVQADMTPVRSAAGSQASAGVGLSHC